MSGNGQVVREKVSIAVSGRPATSGVLTLPSGSMKRTGAIVAHGAGNDMEAPLLVAVSDALAASGYPALRFNFFYRESGRQAQDKDEVLAQAWGAAAAFFRERLGGQIDSWVAAGKSMGGRIASQMAADGLLDASRLVFLGYPLHHPGNREKLRDAHLYRITVPMLFFAGTRDRLCDLETLKSVLGRIKAPWILHVIEGGDHSFHTPKSAYVPDSETYARIAAEAVEWLSENPG